jgi:hypothetical protein
MLSIADCLQSVPSTSKPDEAPNRIAVGTVKSVYTMDVTDSAKDHSISDEKRKAKPVCCFLGLPPTRC